MDAFIGTIIPVAFPYAPQGWALCNGQTLPMSQYQALFSVLGTRFGGDGINTVGLPDLCGRTAVGTGPTQLTPLMNVALGQVIGDKVVSAVSTGVAKATVAANNLPQLPITGTIQGASLSATSTLNATTSGPGPTAPAPGATAPSAGAMLSSTGTGGPSAAIYYVNPTPATPLPAVALSAASVSTVFSGTPTVTASLGAGTPITASYTVTTTPAGFFPMQPSLALNYIICVEGLYPVRPS